MSKYFRITDYSNHQHPVMCRICLWFWVWLEIFDAVIFLITLTIISSNLSLEFLCSNFMTLQMKEKK